MADSIPPIDIGDDAWVDVYAAAGITVGTAIRVQHIGAGGSIYLSIKATTPAGLEPKNNPIGAKLAPGAAWDIVSAQSGLWALATNGTHSLVVQDIS